MSAKYDFTGKRVLVTGGGRGLGLGIVKKFLEANASVIVLEVDSTLLENLQKQFPTVSCHQVNLTDWNATQQVLQSIGTIHHLVNNAGTVAFSEKFFEIQSESVDQVFDINFKAVINVSQVVAKKMVDNQIEGTIVNISSVSDVMSVFGLTVYSCSKAALTMLTKCMAKELGSHGIRVNCVRPAMVRTEFVAAMSESDKETEIFSNAVKAQSRRSIDRMVELSEVGDAVLFLSSSASSITTGSDVLLDGGILTC